MASINRRHDDNKSSSSSGSWNNVLCVLLLLVSNAVTFWTHRLSWPLDSTITPSSSSVAVPQSNAALLWSSAEQQGAPECCHLAYEHSFGLFDDIADHEWREFYQKPSLNPVRYYNPTSPNSNAFQNPTLWVFENYDPWFHCPRQHRLGGLGDGPKYMCDPDRLNRLFETRVRTTAAERRQLPPQPFLAAAHSNKNNHLEKPCLVYSFVDGNRDNFRWEESLAELVPNKCEIHIFDSSRKAPHENPLWPHNNDRNSIHFHPWALTRSQTTSSVETVSFGEIRKRLDHEGRTIDFFKMDCGGCEWDTWSEWIDMDIRQLLLKTHRLSSDPQTFLEAIRARGFELFSKEIDCSNGGRGDSTDWSWIQLAPSFRRNVTASSLSSPRL